MEPTEYSITDGTTTPDNCETEPVHVPGCVLPHGVLLVLDPETLQPLQVSENCVQFGFPEPNQLLASKLDDLFREFEGDTLGQALKKESFTTSTDWLGTVRPADGSQELDLVVHLNKGLLFLELTPVASTVRRLEFKLRQLLGELEITESVDEFFNHLSTGIQKLTNLDRVMVYRFAPDWSGEVIAEATSERSTSRFLGLHFPAMDIPKPARDIYRKIYMRALPDSRLPPSPITPRKNPRTDGPTDMSYCTLRGASEMYTEYLENMGVVASVTACIKKNGELWGLIACHHNEEFRMSPQTAAAFELLSQISSLQLETILTRKTGAVAHEQSELCQKLAVITTEDKLNENHLFDLMERLFPSDGVALCQGGRLTGRGTIPSVADWEHISHSLALRDRGTVPIYHTHHLEADFPKNDSWNPYFGGLFCLGLDESFKECLLWIRKERARKVSWGGNPEDKNIQYGKHGPRLHPRASFETYLETVRGQSDPWTEEELYLAETVWRRRQDDLRRRAAELASLNRRLKDTNQELEAFAAITSHDLREPLRGVTNYVNFLYEDYADQLGADGTHMLERMKYLAVRMNSLLDALLEYSKLHTINLVKSSEDLSQIVDDAMASMALKVQSAGAEVIVGDNLPKIYCYRPFIEAIISNLVSNALKYNTSIPPVVEIDGKIGSNGKTVFWVSDNGIGIPAEKLERIFEVMVRLHHRESAFREGSGLGLSIVRKMVERHGGTIEVTSQPEQGTTFTVTI